MQNVLDLVLLILRAMVLASFYDSDRSDDTFFREVLFLFLSTADVYSQEDTHHNHSYNAEFTPVLHRYIRINYTRFQKSET